MTIKVKKEVVEEMEVKVPFATLSGINWFYIVEENQLTIVCDNFLMRKKRGDDSYDANVKEALSGKKISMEQAFSKLEQVLSTFEQVVI